MYIQNENEYKRKIKGGNGCLDISLAFRGFLIKYLFSHLNMLPCTRLIT